MSVDPCETYLYIRFTPRYVLITFSVDSVFRSDKRTLRNKRGGSWCSPSALVPVLSISKTHVWTLIIIEVNGRSYSRLHFDLHCKNWHPMGQHGNHQELTVTFGKASHGAASCLQNKIIPIVTRHKNPCKLWGFLCSNSLSEEISDTQKIRTNGNLAIS